MKLTSTAFQYGEKIPEKYTCQGEDVNPPLSIEGVPSEAESLALIVDDPDAPSKDWVHWLVFDMASRNQIGEGEVPGKQGTNDFGKKDYGGPCPPSGEHRYYFRLYALDTKLELGEGVGRAELSQAMEGHILDRAKLMGRYSK